MTPDNFKRLKASIDPSYEKLKGFRDEIKRTTLQYAGPHYGGPGAVGESRPINLIEMAVTTYSQNLSSSNPQTLLVTDQQEYRESALELQLAINKTLKRIDFSREHKLWVLSMLFGVGIMRIGLEVTDTAIVDEEELQTTDVFCEAIMFDDWVYDVTATKFDTKQLGFYGHRYSMSLKKAKANPLFDKEAREKLGTRMPPEPERIENLSKGQEGLADKFNEQCLLWDIFVPETQEVVTFSREGGAPDKPLRTVKSKRKYGPYLTCGFNPVLAQVMPSSPASHWFDLDDLTNKLYCKVGEQASRQKTVGLASPSGEQDAGTIMKADDGDVLVVDNPGSFKEFSAGGVDQNTLGAAMNAKAMTSYVMGNLDALAGLGTSAGTLGQEQIIRSSSSERMKAMQTVVAAGTKAILREIAYYLHKHPTLEMDLTREIEGTDVKLSIKWPRQKNEWGVEEDVRKGDFDTDYDLEIIPYSMTDMTPGERLQFLRSFWREDILPLTQLGIQPDINKYLQICSKYAGMPEIVEILPSVAAMSEATGGEKLAKSPISNRNYTRTSVRGGMTPAAAMQQQEMAMMGAGGSNNQTGSI